MALGKCRECGKTVSSEAKTCPQCGVSDPVPLIPARTGIFGGLGCLGTAVAVGVFAVVIVVLVPTCESPAATKKAAVDATSATAEKIARGIAGTPVVAAALDAQVHHDAPGTPHTELHEKADAWYLAQAESLLAVGNKTAADQQLKAITPPTGDSLKPRIAAANARLASFRAARDKAAAAEAHTLAAGNRKSYARDLEEKLLDEHINATVTTFGEGSTGLRMKWILVSRVTAHDFSKNGDFLERLRNRGFKKFQITDGYDETWTWDLTK